ncbi:MAG: hypothetical protein ACXWZT_12845 [Gaiellaceae bacterium]
MGDDLRDFVDGDHTLPAEEAREDDDLDRTAGGVAVQVTDDPDPAAR